MAKKLSEMTVDTPTSVPRVSQPTTVRVVQKSGLAKWIDLNVADLITAVDHYIRTYANPKRIPAREGGITDRRNKPMIKIQEFLISYEKKRE